jgi:hypothetical protein
VLLFREFITAIRTEKDFFPPLADWTDKELAKVWRVVDTAGALPAASDARTHR